MNAGDVTTVVSIAASSTVAIVAIVVQGLSSRSTRKASKELEEGRLAHLEFVRWTEMRIEALAKLALAAQKAISELAGANGTPRDSDQHREAVLAALDARGEMHQALNTLRFLLREDEATAVAMRAFTDEVTRFTNEVLNADRRLTAEELNEPIRNLARLMAAMADEAQQLMRVHSGRAEGFAANDERRAAKS